MRNNQKKDNQKQEKITLESLYAYLHESEEISKREFAQMREEAKQMREEAKQREKEWQKTREELERNLAETARIVHENSKELGTIGNNNGEFAEEYFQSAFQKNPRLNGETYNKVRTNMNPVECDDEYDIFLLNDKSVAIIEVKYSARKKHIGELLQKAENFRKFLPRYNDRKLYLGIASLSFRKVTESKIMEQGIAVIKQVGDKMVIYDKNLKVF